MKNKITLGEFITVLESTVSHKGCADVCIAFVGCGHEDNADRTGYIVVRLENGEVIRVYPKG